MPLSRNDSAVDIASPIVGEERRPDEAPPAATPNASSGRKRTADILLMIAILWIVLKVLQLATGSFSAGALDVTNPSLLGLIGFGCLVAYFFVRPRKGKPQS